jgi:hypothetical protein
MSIWILAIFVMALGALAGWRQGGIRAAFIFVGILFAALLAGPVGRLVHPLLPHLGASNPITAWALAPVFGFIIATIPFIVGAQMVHNRVEHFYKYAAGDLRLALFARLNSRLGICVGVMNGVAYFVLISFFIFNLTYWTTQASAGSTEQPLTVRMVNSLGDGLESSGFSKTASAVGKLSPMYYKLADLSGLLVQNPQLGPRLAGYPGFTSLWHRDDMQQLVTDPIITNALASGASLGEIAKAPSMQAFIQSKDLSKLVLGTVETNLDDLTAYLKTGQSPKYSGELILGNWQFSPAATLAWFRQEQPKMGANEIAAIRAVWTQAYGPTTILLTGYKMVFVKNFPKFIAKPDPNQPPFQPQDWQGDWSKDGSNYTVHISFNGEDKYLSGTTDGLRLSLKDGRTLLLFDRPPQQ